MKALCYTYIHTLSSALALPRNNPCMWPCNSGDHSPLLSKCFGIFYVWNIFLNSTIPIHGILRANIWNLRKLVRGMLTAYYHSKQKIICTYVTRAFTSTIYRGSFSNMPWIFISLKWRFCSIQFTLNGPFTSPLPPDSVYRILLRFLKCLAVTLTVEMNISLWLHYSSYT